MSLSVTIDGLPIEDQGIPPSSVSAASMADMGQAAFGAFTFEDPDASLTVVGHRPVTILEDACSQPRLFTGWTTQRDVGRAIDDGIVVGDDRAQTVTLVDLNALLNFRLISGTDGQRPAETWEARLNWLLGSDYLSGLVSDTGYVATALSAFYLGRPMDAADYRDSYPSAVLDDLATRLEAFYLVYYCFWDVTAGTVGLFFDPDGYGIGTSSLTISNVLSDVDEVTCFPPDAVAKLAREPDQTYSEVTVVYSHGTKRLFRSRASTANTYVRRGTTIQRPFTGGSATASKQAEAFLDRHSVERDRITCTITVPPSAAGLVRAGQLIGVRFSHLPGYETQTTMRVVSSTVRPTDDSIGKYEIALELLAGWTAQVVEVPSFLIALQASGGEDAWEDLSDHPWTRLWWNDDIGATTVIACGAGPTADHMNSMWYRATVPGESATVATFKPETGDLGGFWVWEVAGVDIDAITSANDKLFMDDDTTITVSADVGTQESVLFGTVAWAKVDYDSGWCDGWPDAMVVTTAGTEVINASGHGDCTGTKPWVWLATDQGTGTLSVSAHANSNGYGASAYICGWNVGRGSIVLPLLPGATFSIVQSGFDHTQTPGDEVVVVLASPPTGSAVSTPPDTEVELPPTPGSVVESTSDPTVDDDADDGYQVGQVWINTSSGYSYVLVDATVGAAVWTLITSGSSLNFATSDGTTTVDPTVELTFVNATLTDLGSGVAELTLDAPVPATTVTDETAWDIVPAAGTGTAYARDDHTHGTPPTPEPGGVGPILISDSPSTPLVFADLIQNEAQDDLVYADL